MFLKSVCAEFGRPQSEFCFGNHDWTEAYRSRAFDIQQYGNKQVWKLSLNTLLGGYARMNAISQFPSWLRYFAAIFVAFVVSIAIMAAFVFVGVATGMTSDSSPALSAVYPALTNFLIGFGGVLAGSFCLARAHRALGSLALLVLGIGFEVLVLGQAHGQFTFPRGAITAGIGGLVVVAFHFWRKCQLPNDAA